MYSIHVKLAGALCAIAVMTALAPASRANFTAGNLVIVQVTGNGLGNQNDPAQLQELTTAGATVGSPITLKNAAGAPLVLPDLEDHDGQLTLSVNKNVLTMAAYQDTVGATLAANVDTPTAAPRIIIVVSPSGALNTSTVLTGASDYNAASLRQVTSIDGTQFWTSGNGAKPFGSGTADIGGLRYTTVGASSTTTLNPSGGLDIRSTAIFNGQLYGASGSSNNPTAGHFTFQLGTGEPITGATAFTGLPKTGGGSVSGNQSPVFVTLADGHTFLYTSDSTASALDKFFFDPALQTWTAEGSVALSGIEDLAVSVSGNSVSIFASTATTIASLTDTTDIGNIGPGNANLAFSTIATAAANTQFRGLSFTPTAVPEPASIAIAGAGILALLRRRRSAA